MTAIEIREPAPVAYADAMRPRSLDEAMRLAEMLSKSSFVPTAYRGKPGDVLAAIAFGAELGLAPLTSLQSVATVNGKPCLYSDGLLAVCQSHPAYEWIKETIEGEGDKRVAVCIVKRRGAEPHEQRFSVQDAKAAGLWGKTGPWVQYSGRMLTMRARGFCLRDTFSDAIKGLISREEAEDYPSREPARAEVIAASPQASEPAKSAVESVKAKLAAKKAATGLADVIAGIEAAETLAELDRIAARANKLGDDDKARAREAFKMAKQTLQRNADLVDQEPPHDPDTGEAYADAPPPDDADEPGSRG